jgi:hypothetical protein
VVVSFKKPEPDEPQGGEKDVGKKPEPDPNNTSFPLIYVTIPKSRNHVPGGGVSNTQMAGGVEFSVRYSLPSHPSITEKENQKKRTTTLETTCASRRRITEPRISSGILALTLFFVSYIPVKPIG